MTDRVTDKQLESQAEGSPYELRVKMARELIAARKELAEWRRSWQIHFDAKLPSFVPPALDAAKGGGR